MGRVRTGSGRERSSPKDTGSGARCPDPLGGCPASPSHAACSRARGGERSADFGRLRRCTARALPRVRAPRATCHLPRSDRKRAIAGSQPIDEPRTRRGEPRALPRRVRRAVRSVHAGRFRRSSDRARSLHLATGVAQRAARLGRPCRTSFSPASTARAPSPTSSGRRSRRARSKARSAKAASATPTSSPVRAARARRPPHESSPKRSTASAVRPRSLAANANAAWVPTRGRRGRHRRDRRGLAHRRRPRTRAARAGGLRADARPLQDLHHRRSAHARRAPSTRS